MYLRTGINMRLLYQAKIGLVRTAGVECSDDDIEDGDDDPFADLDGGVIATEAAAPIPMAPPVVDGASAACAIPIEAAGVSAVAIGGDAGPGLA